MCINMALFDVILLLIVLYICAWARMPCDYVAQEVECLSGDRKVSGSIPASSVPNWQDIGVCIHKGFPHERRQYEKHAEEQMANAVRQW